MHIFEVLVYLISFFLNMNYPKEFSVSNEAGLRLLISYLFNNFIELHRRKKKSCEDSFYMPAIVWMDELRYGILFSIVLYSITMVWYNLPPPPKDCLNELDIVLVGDL